MSRWCEAVSLGGTREGGGLSIRPFSEGPRNLKQAKDIFISGKNSIFNRGLFQYKNVITPFVAFDQAEK